MDLILPFWSTARNRAYCTLSSPKLASKARVGQLHSVGGFAKEESHPIGLVVVASVIDERFKRLAGALFEPFGFSNEGLLSLWGFD